VRALFQRAVSAAPAMLFFDEFESLAPQRGSDHTGVTDRVVNQLLTLLDGAERNNKSQQIFVVAATSRPDKIDNALLRPGRLEKHVFLGYPESRTEWNSLFSSILMTRNVDEEVKHFQKNEDLFSFFCHDLDYVKEFCAADLKAVLDTAHLMSVHDFLGTAPTNRDNSHRVIIGKQHILDAFRQTRPSLLPADKSAFLRFYQKFLVQDQEDFGWSSSKVVAELSRHTEPSSIRLKTSLR
jgi:peroxin-1